MKINFKIFLSVTAVLGAAVFLPGLCAGSEWFSPIQIWEHVTGREEYILLEFRFVRLAAALVIGGALALSGAVFQALLRNPLAEPFTLGLSGGAGAGAALAFVCGLRALTVYAVPGMAFAGSLTVLVLVLFISRGGRGGSEGLLLSGVIAGTVASSILMYIVSSSDASELAGISWWMMGSLQAVDTALLLPMAIFTAAAFLTAQFFAMDINALAIGEEYAWHLGVNTRCLMLVMVLIAALLAAGTVALAGMIGFCGLVIPHIVRRIAGCDYRKVLPGAFFGGGVFLMLCDTLSRLADPVREVPIGVITSIIGGPVFLWLLTRCPAAEGGR